MMEAKSGKRPSSNCEEICTLGAKTVMLLRCAGSEIADFLVVFDDAGDLAHGARGHDHVLLSSKLSLLARPCAPPGDSHRPRPSSWSGPPAACRRRSRMGRFCSRAAAKAVCKIISRRVSPSSCRSALFVVIDRRDIRRRRCRGYLRSARHSADAPYAWRRPDAGPRARAKDC